MTCPSCNSPLEPNARFCGVCGHRQAPVRSMQSGGGPPVASAANGTIKPKHVANVPVAPGPQVQRAIPKPSRPKSGDEIYINQVLNNRFKVESKIGEGGFGAVYR